ncbi:MAG: PilZ domain-containing protein [Terracidiphilus sp.]
MEDTVESESPARSKVSWMSRLLRWLTTNPAKRYSLPGLVAYYWTSGTPKACSVGNISSSGMYIVDDERWLPGSVIPMTLQKDSAAGREDWIAVLTQVVRSGPDGHGLAFSFSRSTNLFGNEIPPERLADNKALKRFLKHLKL